LSYKLRVSFEYLFAGPSVLVFGHPNNAKMKTLKVASLRSIRAIYSKINQSMSEFISNLIQWRHR